MPSTIHWRWQRWDVNPGFPTPDSSTRSWVRGRTSNGLFRRDFSGLQQSSPAAPSNRYGPVILITHPQIPFLSPCYQEFGETANIFASLLTSVSGRTLSTPFWMERWSDSPTLHFKDEECFCTMLRAQDTWSQGNGFPSCLHHLLAVCLWTSHLPSESQVPICKTRVIPTPSKLDGRVR